MKPLFAFEKVGSAQTLNRGSGLGIGLSTVNALTKALQGAFWVDVHASKKRVEAHFEVPLGNDVTLSTEQGSAQQATDSQESSRRFCMQEKILPKFEWLEPDPHQSQISSEVNCCDARRFENSDEYGDAQGPSAGSDEVEYNCRAAEKVLGKHKEKGKSQKAIGGFRRFHRKLQAGDEQVDIAFPCFEVKGGNPKFKAARLSGQLVGHQFEASNKGSNKSEKNLRAKSNLDFRREYRKVSVSKSQEVDQKKEVPNPIGELNPQQEPKKEDALFASVAKIEKPVFRSAPHPKIPLLEDFVSKRNKAFEGYLERRGGTQRMFSTACTAMCHRSLLVIEDDPMITYVLKNMLLTVGTLAHYCQDSAEAVRDFQQNLRNTCCSNKFTLVLTDIQMPG